MPSSSGGQNRLASQAEAGLMVLADRGDGQFFGREVAEVVRGLRLPLTELHPLAEHVNIADSPNDPIADLATLGLQPIC